MSSSDAGAAPGEDYYRKLERIYLSAPINEIYRPAIRISRGAAEIAITVHRQFHHGGNAVHGSVYFKSLDDAAFFAVNSLVEGFLVVTASFTVYFLRPITEGSIRAVGKVVHEGGSAFVAESVLWNGDGQEIARGSGSFVKTRTRFND
jgi:uncharacterized protein (TIGR00369 family)